MRTISIDTNVYVAFKQGHDEVVSILRNCDSISLDVTVLAELLSGFKCGHREKKNRDDLYVFLNTPRVHILEHDYSTTEYYASLFAFLRKKGTPIPTNDIWIAANAMRHGLALFSFDSHFAHIDGLLLVKM